MATRDIIAINLAATNEALMQRAEALGLGPLELPAPQREMELYHTAYLTALTEFVLSALEAQAKTKGKK